MNIGQNIIDLIRGKKELVLKIKDNNSYKLLHTFQGNLKPCKQVVFIAGGFAYSGTSALIGFMNEFDNVLVYGNCDKVYSKNKKRGGYEVKWFMHSGFFNFVDNFKDKNKSVIEIDMSIKLFIRQVYRAFKHKSLMGWDRSPSFYNKEFVEINETYLKAVLDFNEYDLTIMENNPIPRSFNSDDTTYENCSFMQEKGIRQYLFYKFRDITDAEFDRYTNVYINKLFERFGGKDLVLFDKPIDVKNHKKLNYFIKDKPIKEICFLRDPRDEFLSTYRFSFATANPPTTSAREWIDYYKEKADALKANRDENMLVVRFEDFVYDYDNKTKEIMNFLDLKEENHIAPKTIFDPEISKVNIGAWKYFIDQDLMKQIGEELSEYCYNI